MLSPLSAQRIYLGSNPRVLNYIDGVKEMRKFLCLAICAFVLIGSLPALAQDNITFLDIPWLSNEEIVFKALSESGYLRFPNEFSDFSHEDCSYLSVDASSKTIEIVSAQQNKSCISTKLGEHAKGKIAGHAVSNIELTFAYNGDYQLIYARIELTNANHEELRQKLTKVYGEPEEYDADGDPVSVWRSENNSCVALFEYYDGKAYDLCYGRVDAAEIIANCINVDPNDVSGL